MGVFLCVLLERFAPDANNLDLLAILAGVECDLVSRRVTIKERQDKDVRGFSVKRFRDISDRPAFDEFVHLCVFSQCISLLIRVQSCGWVHSDQERSAVHREGLARLARRRYPHQVSMPVWHRECTACHMS